MLRELLTFKQRPSFPRYFDVVLHLLVSLTFHEFNLHSQLEQN